MTATVEYATSPLYLVREQIAAYLLIDTGFETLPDFTAGCAPPCIMLDGGGWSSLTGCQINYQLRVNVIAGVPATPIPVAEEMTRKVWDALARAGYPIDTVPPPGVLTFGSGSSARELVACQFTISVPLDPIL